jgi:hypothetical protein
MELPIGHVNEARAVGRHCHDATAGRCELLIVWQGKGES